VWLSAPASAFVVRLLLCVFMSLRSFWFLISSSMCVVVPCCSGQLHCQAVFSASVQMAVALVSIQVIMLVLSVVLCCSPQVFASVEVVFVLCLVLGLTKLCFSWLYSGWCSVGFLLRGSPAYLAQWGLWWRYR
jgi:hypothetical protein